MDKKVEFSCLDSFFYRVPRNSISYAENKMIEMYSHRESCDYTPDIRENILLASRSLYNNIDKNSLEVKNSLMRYILRSSTRTTPFSLLAGMGRGRFLSQNNIFNQIDTKKYYRKTRVSYQWLSNIISKLEFSIGEDLFVKMNTTLIISPYNVTNMWLSNFYDSSMNGIHSSIINNKLIGAILNNTSEFIKIKDLVSMLSTQFEPEVLIRKTIDVLLKREFLISDCRIPLTELHQLEKLINILENEYPQQIEFINKCKKVEEYIDEIDQLPLGAAEKEYLNLLDYMEEINDASDYLCTDLFQKSELILTSKMKQDINCICKYMLGLSDLFGKSIKYDSIDQINEMLHENYSDTYVQLSIVWKDIEEIILRTYLEEGKEEIEQEDLLKIMLLSMNKERNPILMNLDEMLKNKKRSDCNIRPFELALNLFQDQNGDTIYLVSNVIGYSRWGRGMSKYAYEMAYIGKEDYFKELDYCEVEISFMPKDNQSANISLITPFSDYVLYYGAENEKKIRISLDDIYLTGYKEHILFYSKKMKKRLEFVLNNNINEMKLPPVLKFLINATDQYYTSIFRFNKELEERSRQMVSVPQVRYKNYIFQPHCWNMHYEINHLCNEDEFIQLLHKFREEFSIPDLVFIKDIENEQYIRMNFNQREQVHDLYHQFKANKYIQIQEDLNSMYNSIVIDENKDYYYTDFLFYLKCNNQAERKLKFYEERFIDQSMNLKSILFPFEENWITIKIYVETILHECFLTTLMKPFVNELDKNEIIDQYFFVRYIDSKPHIRLRIKAKDCKIYQVVDRIMQFEKEIQKKEVVESICIVPYKRELVRYGGPELYLYCEKIFCMESKMVLEILSNKEIGKRFSKAEIAVLYLTRLLFDMKFTYSECLEILKDFLDDTSYTSPYRRIRRQLLTLLNPHNNWENLKDSSEGKRLHEILDMRNEVVFLYRNKLEKFSRNQEYIFEIIRSIMHLSLNRLIGFQRRGENEVYLFTYLTLKSLMAIESKEGNMKK